MCTQWYEAFSWGPGYFSSITVHIGFVFRVTLQLNKKCFSFLRDSLSTTGWLPPQPALGLVADERGSHWMPPSSQTPVIVPDAEVWWSLLHSHEVSSMPGTVSLRLMLCGRFGTELSKHIHHVLSHRYTKQPPTPDPFHTPLSDQADWQTILIPALRNCVSHLHLSPPSLSPLLKPLFISLICHV